MHVMTYSVAAESSRSPDATTLMQALSQRLAAITGDSGNTSYQLDDLDDRRACFAVARDAAGRPLGCGALRPLEGNIAELKRMYAQENSAGVGTAVLAYLERQAQVLGYGAIRLETRRVNERAVAFYLGKGYRVIPNYGRYVGNERAVCFEKRLNDMNKVQNMDIRIDDLRSPEIIGLLEEHLADMYRVSPPESVHALDLDGLRRPEITFWSIWEGEQLAGCIALKELDAQHGEIKSMRTASSFRGKGAGKQLLQHLLAEAARRDYRRLSLETGPQAFFEPARTLYARFGFESCGPFADYWDDPFSVFMTRAV